MYVDLSLHGRKIESVFQLLGVKENDLTYSLGWALTQCPDLRNSLLSRLYPRGTNVAIDRVLLQEHCHGSGYTDVELVGQSVHVIVEAKRGWVLPTTMQLESYACRFEGRPKKTCRLVTTSECSVEYASHHLPAKINGIQVTHVPWGQFQKLARTSRGTHAEKRLLKEFRTYLERVIKMQNQTSNLVYVVAIGSARPKWSKISWIDIVEKRKRYFHPMGGGWPKEPPNYVGFRYGGRLQRVRFATGCI